MAISSDKKLNNFLSSIKKLSQNDKERVVKAIEFSSRAHRGQTRISGSTYFSHALDVAKKISDLNLTTDAIIASLLHDTVEDTPIGLNEIKKEFGSVVARLVDGLTKLDNIRISKSWLPPFKTKYQQLDRYEKQVETLRKMFVAMSRDIRVIIIKMADRMCNLETLYYLPKVKQTRIAQETIDIYAPIANRLGMGEFKCRLEDLSFPYLMPNEYKRVKKLAVQEIETRTKYLKKLRIKILNILAQKGINAEIKYRAKHWYSLYRKLKIHNLDIDKVYDLVALRVMVPTVEDCYNVLGIIHSLWKPLPDTIKDYIALPKINGYQSIHTTVFADHGVITEIQIRTPDMDRQAEFGIAAHWYYSDTKVSRLMTKKQYAWVKELMAWQSKIKSSKDLKQSLKIDMFCDRIFAFTPAGDVIDLPRGATSIDFAYAIHTAVGNQCVGAKINNKIAALSTDIKNGDIVEILKDKKSKPKQDWLKYVKTEQARDSINKIVKTR